MLFWIIGLWPRNSDTNVCWGPESITATMSSSERSMHIAMGQNWWSSVTIPPTPPEERLPGKHREIGRTLLKSALDLILFCLLKWSLTWSIGWLGCRFRNIQWPETWSCWKETRPIKDFTGRLDFQGIWGGGGWIDSWIDTHCWQLKPLKWSSMWEMRRQKKVCKYSHGSSWSMSLNKKWRTIVFSTWKKQGLP